MIAVICRGDIAHLPPVLSVIQDLIELGEDVSVLSSYCSVDLPALCGIDPGQCHTTRESFTPPGHSILRKIAAGVSFRRAAWAMLDQAPDDCLIWVASADTAIVLGRKLTRKRYILQLHELYDRMPAIRALLAPIVKKAACVVVPERHRGAMLRSWFGLETSPLVLPNKPRLTDCERNQFLSDERAREAIKQIGTNRKLVLYQGHIGNGKDLLRVAKAIATLGDPWRFVVMGRDHGLVQALRTQCPGIVHIPFICPPDHLTVTSHAHIGIVGYSFDSLNNVFCAPNKIWEYAAFGIPILGNNVPGLLDTVADKGFGLCYDSGKSDDIIRALLRLDSEYQRFSVAARAAFREIDRGRIVTEALQTARTSAEETTCCLAEVRP
jgi:glycosyltransferase involved in cell wall biosynthesis